MRKSIGIAVTALLVIAAFGIMPASAVTLPDWNDFCIKMANEARFNNTDSEDLYAINWTQDYGGLNAIHISDNPVTHPTGDIYDLDATEENLTGTFYVTDTGGRHFQDDIVLLAAVYFTPGDNDLVLSLDASGYQWDPTGNGMAPASAPYNSFTLDETFTDVNFTEESSTDVQQDWKPGVHGVGSVGDYPIFDGSSDDYYLIFVDTWAGTLSINGTLIDNGSVKVNYDLSESELPSGSTIVFNAYAWNNLTARNATSLQYDIQGIRWTNNVTGTTDSSVWRVTAP